MAKPNILLGPRSVDLGGRPHDMWLVSYGVCLATEELEPPVSNAILASRVDLDVVCIGDELSEFNAPLIVRNETHFLFYDAQEHRYGFASGSPYWAKECLFLFKRGHSE